MWAGVFLIFLVVGITLVLVFVPSASASKKSEGLFQTSNREVAPLTVHFIYGLWDETPMPKSYADNIEAWRALGWTTRIWDRPSVEALIQEHYPDMWTFYQNLPRAGQKADWSRYFIIYHFGNFYMDADVQPSPKSDLLQRIRQPLQDFYAFVEVATTEKQAKQVALKNPIRKGVPEIHGDRLANYAFGCPPKHPALLKVMQLAKQRCEEHPVLESSYDVLYTTGPDVFTTALDGDNSIIRWKHQSDFKHTCSHAWIGKKNQPKSG